MAGGEAMSDYTMTIGGAAVAGTRSFEVLDPATNARHASAPECSREELDAAMAAAAAAFPGWRADEAARREALSAAAKLVKEAAAQLATEITAEQGKPLREARYEALAGESWLTYYANLALPREVIQDDERALVEVVTRPLGVVAAITPWNFPVSAACMKIAPALAAGNTVVLKPSPFTPLATLRLGELLRPVFPPGVLSVVSGGDALGARMTEHPAVRKITFTGSVATGKRVAAAAVPDLKRITLELGGNDPALVLDDASVDAVADGIFWSSFANAGQICSAIKRVYAPASLHGALVDALAERARAVRVGRGTEKGTQLGPITTRPQFERVRELVADALARGARAAAGGAPLEGPGNFFAPTVLTNVEDGMRIVDEEQFGPVLPVVAYRDLEDAVAAANGTHFGLDASVWSADPERAAKVARRLECGTAWINTHLVQGPAQPFRGAKWSGIGVENGPWGLAGFYQLQTLYHARR
jgi:acyl-CoA reductase-like NAD-dependent aldehyde dehydrogenase